MWTVGERCRLLSLMHFYDNDLDFVSSKFYPNFPKDKIQQYHEYMVKRNDLFISSCKTLMNNPALVTEQSSMHLDWIYDFCCLVQRRKDIMASIQGNGFAYKWQPGQEYEFDPTEIKFLKHFYSDVDN